MPGLTRARSFSDIFCKTGVRAVPACLNLFSVIPAPPPPHLRNIVGRIKNRSETPFPPSLNHNPYFKPTQPPHSPFPIPPPSIPIHITSFKNISSSRRNSSGSLYLHTEKCTDHDHIKRPRPSLPLPSFGGKKKKKTYRGIIHAEQQQKYNISLKTCAPLLFSHEEDDKKREE